METAGCEDASCVAERECSCAIVLRLQLGTWETTLSHGIPSAYRPLLTTCDQRISCCYHYIIALMRRFDCRTAGGYECSLSWIIFCNAPVLLTAIFQCHQPHQRQADHARIRGHTKGCRPSRRGCPARVRHRLGPQLPRLRARPPPLQVRRAPREAPGRVRRRRGPRQRQDVRLGEEGRRRHVHWHLPLLRRLGGQDPR